MMHDVRDYKTVPISYKESFAVSFLYNCLPGRVLLKLLVRPSISKIVGHILDSSASRILIRGFIKRNNIKMEEYQAVRYKSFNAFFIREINKGYRPFPKHEFDLAAPCDGKLTAYPISEDSIFRIKNSIYTIESLLCNKALAAGYCGGVCLFFRLTPDDHHRYAYIDDGKILYHKRIKGVLHTVRPISQIMYNVFAQNTREYEVIKTKNFGKVVQMEVGALFVGYITNLNTKTEFKRGDEKGMFEFGGSTVIMLFQKDNVTIDKAILENTQQEKETIVRMGLKIGEKTIKGYNI